MRRRDFTVNGLLYDPLEDTLIDHVGGEADLRRGIIRAIGEPAERFKEDHLRMLRAVRFAYTLDFDLEATTSEALRERAADIQKVSAERIEHELTRILTESPRPGAALRCLYQRGYRTTYCLSRCAHRGNNHLNPSGGRCIQPYARHARSRTLQNLIDFTQRELAYSVPHVLPNRHL